MMNALAAPGAAALNVEATAADCLVAALRRHCCTAVRRASGASEFALVEGWKGNEHLLMCVRPAVAPTEPGEFAEDEADAFRREAARAGANPWVAHVVLDRDMELKRLDWWPLEE